MIAWVIRSFHALVAMLAREVTVQIGRTKLLAHLESFTGLEHVPSHGGFIVVANHQSYFDSIVLSGVLRAVLGRRVHIPTKTIAFRSFWRSVWHTALGAVPIEQSDPKTAYTRIESLLRAGEVVLMFPEGERSLDGKLLPFRYGAFNLSVSTGAPILPAALRDAGKVLPKGSMRFRRGTRGSVAFGALLWPAASKHADTPQTIAGRLLEETRAFITSVLSESTTRLLTQRDRIAIADAIESRVEHVLNDGLDEIRFADARELLRGCLLVRHWCRDFDPLEVQYLRVRGFYILTLAKPFALFFLHGYRRALERTLKRLPNQPYIHYFVGQLHSRVPRILGGRRERAAHSFGRAYYNAAAHGLDPERFANSYADALLARGELAEALTVLRAHFSPAAETPRLWRRRLRAETMLLKLANRGVPLLNDHQA